MPVSYTHLDVYKRQVAENSRSIDFGEDRLRERGSLPAKFYVLTRLCFLANDKSLKFTQNQLLFAYSPEL